MRSASDCRPVTCEVGIYKWALSAHILLRPNNQNINKTKNRQTSDHQKPMSHQTNPNKQVQTNLRCSLRPNASTADLPSCIRLRLCQLSPTAPATSYRGCLQKTHNQSRTNWEPVSKALKQQLVNQHNKTPKQQQNNKHRSQKIPYHNTTVFPVTSHIILNTKTRYPHKGQKRTLPCIIWLTLIKDVKKQICQNVFCNSSGSVFVVIIAHEPLHKMMLGFVPL